MQTDVHLWSSLFQFFLEWEMFQANVMEKLKTHILCSNIFFENRAVYEIMWKNTVEPDRPQMAIWRMRIACWIPKATNTLSICNTYCSSPATMVAPSRLNVTLYERCLVHCTNHCQKHTLVWAHLLTVRLCKFHSYVVLTARSTESHQFHS